MSCPNALGVRRRDLLGASVLLLIPTARLAAAQGCRASGRYSGPIVARLLSNGRDLELVQAVTYTARCGKAWPVPIGAISNGASVPAFLWRSVGTPLVGAYRDAAVIHDYYCSVRVAPSDEVHAMFYEAMLASGVSLVQATAFYWGVKLGGPSWDELTIANTQLSIAHATPPSTSKVPLPSKPDRSLGTVGALTTARLTVARDAAADQRFKQFVGSINGKTPDLAALDASARAASIGVERQALASTYAPLLDPAKAVDPQAQIPLQASMDPVTQPSDRPIS